ncbi:hypothetical protein PLICRDRAFT_113015 [Plicaturopsis crispa FD-325 SS-3]|nr:hypothetical protein PLICRDRAFT_113015 [Plicaturopsis crispa FD-325 SS-3]
MPSADNLNLVPPQVESGDVEGFISSGRTLSASFSPLHNSLAVFSTTNTVSQPSRQSTQWTEQPVYFASTDSVPSSERRLFVVDTSVIFAALQNLNKSASTQRAEWLQTEKIQQAVRKLTIDYVNFTKECWAHTSQPINRPDGPVQFPSEHYRRLYTCFSLFLVLYLPEGGFEDAPVGDDLMEWLNIHYIEPSTEEGDNLSGLERPWEDESFWPYLTRATLRGLSKASIFFLGVLSRHPSEDLHRLSERLTPLLETQPRLQNFSSERDFVYASRRWKDQVKAMRVDMDRVPENDRQDDFENWWDRLSDIVSILEGRGEAIQRICEELGADWKEVCAAWAVFVDPRLRRQDLPDIVGPILDDMPPDPTNVEDMIHAALMCAEPSKALQHASQLDRWLSAHLSDLMHTMELIDTGIDEDSGLTLRDQHVLAYAEYLHSDPGFWRLTVDYMCSCGHIGNDRADEVLLRVPLRLHNSREDPHAPTGTQERNEIRAGDVVGVLKEVNETCFEHQRERARRAICRIAAQTFVQEKDYGLAVSYCTSAEDWPGLGRVVDRVLDEYVVSGPLAFARYVADIAPSLQALRGNAGPQGIFVHRLMFAVRYAEFHQRRSNQELEDAAIALVSMFHEDIAPKPWWGILLCDAIEFLQYSSTLLFTSADACVLLRKLDEIFVRTEQGSGEDYLGVLTRVMKGGGEKEALHRLRSVRLALARYFARCTVVGVGGKQGVEHQAYISSVTR